LKWFSLADLIIFEADYIYIFIYLFIFKTGINLRLVALLNRKEKKKLQGNYRINSVTEL